MINSLAQALDLSAEVLLDQAGLLRDLRGKTVKANTTTAGNTEAAIQADDRLSKEQKRALLAVYESYVSADPSHLEG